MAEPGSKAVAKAAESQGTKAEQKVEETERTLLALAKTFEEKQAAWLLISRYRQSQMIREAATAIAETTWGKDLSPLGRAAVARYALETGTDPVRHWEVLGGRLYDRAELYYDLLAATPDFVRDDVEFIHDDVRASAEERERRKLRRVEYGVPDVVGEAKVAVKAAAVVTLTFKDRGPFVGVNWAPRNRSDPVGDAEPVKCAQTRAYRKAAKKACPIWFLKHGTQLAAAEQVLAQAKLAPAAEHEPEPIVADESPIAALPPGPTAAEPTPAPAPEKLERHEPTKICAIEGPHAHSSCGYHKPKATA